jgi:hemerythrin-like domain-containing protein
MVDGQELTAGNCLSSNSSRVSTQSVSHQDSRTTDATEKAQAEQYFVSILDEVSSSSPQRKRISIVAVYR